MEKTRHITVKLAVNDFDTGQFLGYVTIIGIGGSHYLRHLVLDSVFSDWAPPCRFDESGGTVRIGNRKFPFVHHSPCDKKNAKHVETILMEPTAVLDLLNYLRRHKSRARDGTMEHVWAAADGPVVLEDKFDANESFTLDDVAKLVEASA